MPDSKTLTYRLLRALIRTLLPLIARVEIEGAENIPPRGGCIIASNHLGRLDVPMVLYTLQREDLILIIAEKYRRVALFRYLARKLDMLFVDRYEADFATVREVLRRLKRGGVFVVAPEGTRSPTESLLPGRPGTAYLAQHSGAPVVPAGITGTEDRVVKANLKRLRRTRIRIRIGTPFTLPPRVPGADREAALQEATDTIMCRIAALLPERYRGMYAGRCDALPSET